MANINTKELGAIRLPKPPIPLQEKFALAIKEIRRERKRFLENNADVDDLAQAFVSQAFLGNLTAYWRISHIHDLEIAARARDAALGQANGKTVITEYAPPAHREVPQPERYWLTNHLGSVQGIIWEALQEWSGTLIPSEDLDTFRQSAPRMEQIEDANDHILRALSQLAGLGFIAQVSVPNQQGEYVTGYRGLREGEHLLPADLQLAVESQR